MVKRRDVVRSVEMLKQINASIVGTVLNRAPETDSYAYYHYGYGYEQKSSDKVRSKNDKKRGAPVTTNGNGKMAAGTSPVKILPTPEVENADWPSMGRHARVAQPPMPGLPTLSPPQTGDAPSE